RRLANVYVRRAGRGKRGDWHAAFQNLLPEVNHEERNAFESAIKKPAVAAAGLHDSPPANPYVHPYFTRPTRRWQWRTAQRPHFLKSPRQRLAMGTSYHGGSA